MWGRTDEGFASLPSMKDVLFVMTRLQIRMDEYPKWWDTLRSQRHLPSSGPAPCMGTGERVATRRLRCLVSRCPAGATSCPWRPISQRRAV
jgi:hypothetical protein